MVSFKNLHFRLEGTPLVSASLTDTMPHIVLKKHLDYQSSIPVSWRSSAVRVVFMKLAATGVLCALVAGYSNNAGVAWCCTLAAATNFVACIHYSIIWMIRAQALPTAFSHLLLGRNNTGLVIPVGGSSASEADAKAENATGAEADSDRTMAIMYAQENAVDALRFSDWVVT